MNYLWLGTFIFAAVQIARAEIFQKLSGDPWPWLLIGLLAFAAARGTDRVERLPARWLLAWAAVGTLAVLAWGPLDGHAGLLLVAAALSALALRGRTGLAFLPTALSTAGLVALAQSATLATFRSVGADWHGFAWLNAWLAKPLGWLGLRVGVLDDSLLLQHSDGLHRFAPGFDQMGGLFVVVIAAGAFVVLCTHSSRPLREFLRVIGLLASYAVLRYVVILASFHLHRNPTFLWMVTPQILSWAPSILLLSRFVRLDRMEASPRLAPTTGAAVPQVLRIAALGLAVGATAVLALHFHDPGELKRGRVLFDELHSNWEWTDRPMGTDEYGLGTSYNYANLYEHLDRHYELDRNWETLTEDVLDTCDVLVLRTPTRAYAPEEIASIQSFVREGGGLWMIGDHTDVFGTSRRLNPLAKEFGMRFRHDAEYDLKSGSLNQFEIPPHQPHPVVSHMPDFLCATGCTIEINSSCRPVMNANAINALPADYSQRSFFPRDSIRQDFGFGLYTMCASREYGAGRVLAFSDSTVFSNFFMYIPGKPEFALGSIDWLNRTNRWSWVPRVALPALAILSLAAIALALRNAWARTLPLVLLGALGGSAGASLLCAQVVRTGYGEVEQREPAERIHFNLEHSTMFLPIARLQGGGDNDYSTFLTWCQRVDLVPTVHQKLTDALDHPEPGILLLADLHRPPLPAELDRIERSVRDGGVLLLVHSPFANAQASNLVLKPFGLRLGEHYPDIDGGSEGDSPGTGLDGPAELPAFIRDYAPEHDHPGSPIEASSPAPAEVSRMALAAPFDDVFAEHLWPVIGGQPLLTDIDGKSVIAFKDHGKGMVLAVGCGELFSTPRMGTVSVQPNAEQRDIYELLFAVLRLAARRGSPPLEDLLGEDYLAARVR